ncbi:UvrD-helicase domain-containing protein [Pseudomonas japonica]|uniref:UvrD-helicase domain-containing protein n=1 Tax=Pseudomonas japonica TaxID=256466 RepID=UPI0015E34287|nr:UvrD-helicase domain-containing protein [Pseudomonas japonica]MBA1288648.1 UvrD-helicase domain-containing protein [Pseudomonas japonica]
MARLIAPQAQPTAAQWKMIFSGAITTCVVAGAGSGKSSSLALRIVLLTQYLGVPLSDISVVTFTRASRADFAERLVRLFKLWGQALSMADAYARVTTFHAMALAWARTMPGFAQLRAFESLGEGEGAGDAFQLKVNPAQRDQLNGCFQRLVETDHEFASIIRALRLRASRMAPLPEAHPEVQRRLVAMIPAAERDAVLCDLIEARWREAGHWPLPGVSATRSEHRIHGQVFLCHGYNEAQQAWVMLGADPSMGDASRPGARLPVRAEWAVKRTLFQAFFDKPLIWIESFAEVNVDSEVLQGAGIDYKLSGENRAQPLLDAFVAIAGFIENLGLEVPTAAASLENGEDGLFFQALRRYWPALEKQLLGLTPPVLSYNRMFAIFSAPQGSALSRLPEAKLYAIRHLLVDEFQDISPQIARWLQAGLAERLRRDAATSATLVCVGDDWQSIYGWRGSSPEFFMRFAQAFPSPGFRRLMLRENFRSNLQIIEAAEFLVGGIEAIPGKNAVAAGAQLNIEGASGVHIHVRNDDTIARIAQEALDTGATVLLLYRQASDDPRKAPAVQAILQAQSKLATEARRLRCMTIHASKGLEAHVVLLIGDCAARPAAPARNQLYTLAGLGSEGAVAPYDQAQAEEALRLAYVGITRAAKAVHWFLEPTAAARAPGGAAARATSARQLFQPAITTDA